MATIKMFKAAKDTNKFNKNQVVWVAGDYANHLCIVFKYRGKGRYIKAYMNKWNNKGTGLSNKIKDSINEIDVDAKFIEKISYILTR